MHRNAADFPYKPDHLTAWLAQFAARRRAPIAPPTRRPATNQRWIPQAELSFFPKDFPAPKSGEKSALSAKDKLARISETFIDNEQSRLAFGRLDLMMRKRLRRDFRILVFTGETRTGKTRILSEFVCKHPPARETVPGGRRTRWPVLYLTGIPAPATVKGLCHVIFRQLGLATVGRCSIPKAVETTIRLIKDLGISMLVIDEAQVVCRANALEIRRISDFIKTLVRQKICQVVLAGTPKLKSFERFCRFVPQSHLRLRNFLAEEPERFEALIRSICTNLPLPCIIHPDDVELLDLISKSGAVGSIVGLFKSAAVRALAAGASRIEGIHFQSARDDFCGEGEEDFCEFDPRLLQEEEDFEGEPPNAVVSMFLKKKGDYLKARRTPLPIGLDPATGESLKGFMARLALANGLPSIRALLKLYEVPDYVGSSSYDQKNWVMAASAAAEVPWRQLAWSACLLAKGGDGKMRTRFMGKLCSSGVFHGSFRWCPLCLKEGSFHQAIWQLASLKVCVKHRVYLMTHCPRCCCEVGYQVPVDVCPTTAFDFRCGTRLDSMPARRCNWEDLKAGREVLQKFGLLKKDGTIGLRHPHAPRPEGHPAH